MTEKTVRECYSKEVYSLSGRRPADYARKVDGVLQQARGQVDAAVELARIRDELRELRLKVREAKGTSTAASEIRSGATSPAPVAVNKPIDPNTNILVQISELLHSKELKAMNSRLDDHDKRLDQLESSPVVEVMEKVEVPVVAAAVEADQKAKEQEKVLQAILSGQQKIEGRIDDLNSVIHDSKKNYEQALFSLKKDLAEDNKKREEKAEKDKSDMEDKLSTLFDESNHLRKNISELAEIVSERIEAIEDQLKMAPSLDRLSDDVTESSLPPVEVLQKQPEATDESDDAMIFAKMSTGRRTSQAELLGPKSADTAPVHQFADTLAEETIDEAAQKSNIVNP